MWYELATALGLVSGVLGVAATIAIALVQMGQTTREYNTTNNALVEMLAIILARFDRLDRATAEIRSRLR